MDLISAYGAIVATAVGLFEVGRYLYDKYQDGRPKIEIDVHLPESTKALVPLLEGIVPEGRSVEDTLQQILDIKSNGGAEWLHKTFAIILSNCVNDPREAKIRIFIKNIGKRTVNLVSYTILIKSDVIGKKALKTMERSKMVLPGEQHIEELKIGDLLDMLALWSPTEDDKLQVLYQFKDEKNRIYSANQPFDYISWAGKVAEYKKLRNDIKEFERNIAPIADMVSQIVSTANTDKTNEMT